MSVICLSLRYTLDDAYFKKENHSHNLKIALRGKLTHTLLYVVVPSKCGNVSPRLLTHLCFVSFYSYLCIYMHN